MHLVVLFSHKGHRDQTGIVRFGRKYLDLLNHRTMISINYINYYYKNFMKLPYWNIGFWIT